MMLPAVFDVRMVFCKTRQRLQLALESNASHETATRGGTTTKWTRSGVFALSLCSALRLSLLPSSERRADESCSRLCVWRLPCSLATRETGCLVEVRTGA